MARQPVAGVGQIAGRGNQVHAGFISGVPRPCRAPKTGISSRQFGASRPSRGLIQGRKMRHALVLMIVSLLSTALAAREIGDATGRRIPHPDRVERVMAAGPTAAVVLYVLAPDLM